MKKLLLATLLALTTLTVGATTVKADDMRDTCEGIAGDIHTYGYMTLEDHTKGADFSLGYYEDDVLSDTGLSYFKVVDNKTVKLVGTSNKDGYVNVDADYIQWNGVKYKNIVIGTDFKNNKKIKSIEFDNANSVVIKSKGAFENSSLRYIKLKGIKEIPANCFKNCQKLGGVTIEDAHKFKTFGSNSFYNCKKLNEIHLISDKWADDVAVTNYMKKHGKITAKNNVFKNSSATIWMGNGKMDTSRSHHYYPVNPYFKYNSKKSCLYVHILMYNERQVNPKNK